MLGNECFKKDKNIPIKCLQNNFASFNFHHWSTTAKIKQCKIYGMKINPGKIFQVYGKWLNKTILAHTRKLLLDFQWLVMVSSEHSCHEQAHNCPRWWCVYLGYNYAMLQ